MSSRSARFTVLLFWNSVAFIVSLMSAFVLSPLVVRGLGIEAYGVWALVFSMLDYLNVADLGIRSATVKYVAHYSALDDPSNLHKTLNAGLTYFMGIALLMASLVFFFAKLTVSFLNIPPALVSDYVLLLRLTGVTMAFQLLFNVPRAALEAVQDFRTVSRINICVSTIRLVLSLLVLSYRPGLAGLGYATVAASWAGFLMMVWTFRRRFPSFVLSARNLDKAIFRQLFHYGLPTLLGSLASQFLHSGPILLLGILKDAASVGYYSLVLRMLAGFYELISQAGGITTSVTSRLAAEDDQSALRRAVLYLNRYAFAIFSFVFVFLMVFGNAFLTRWVGPEVAAHCMPLIPWLAFAYAAGAAAHQNSVATLFGLGAHHWYNYGLVIEALVLLGGWMFFVPTRPLSFAAAWWAVSLVLNRGLRPSWLVSRALAISFTDLLGGIFLRPLAVSSLTAALAVLLLFNAPHTTWFSLVALASVLGVFHLCCCFVLVLAPEHRRLLLNFRTALKHGVTT